MEHIEISDDSWVSLGELVTHMTLHPTSGTISGSGGSGGYVRTYAVQPPINPEVYSICEIQVVGGALVPFMVKASPSLMQHAIAQMRETGFLYLWNDTESLCIRADSVVAVRMSKMTTER